MSTAGAGRDGELRVSDGDRARVARRLQDAQGEGRLTLVEFDERVRAAHGAVVRADLEPLLADLPDDPGESVEGPWARADAEQLGAERQGAGRQSTDRRPGAHPSPPRTGTRPLPGVVPFAMPCGALGLRGAAAAWAATSLINLVIWVAVVAGTGHLVHPWWIWVAGPWGLVLLARLGARHGLARVVN